MWVACLGRFHHKARDFSRGLFTHPAHAFDKARIYLAVVETSAMLLVQAVAAFIRFQKTDCGGSAVTSIVILPTPDAGRLNSLLSGTVVIKRREIVAESIKWLNI